MSTVAATAVATAARLGVHCIAVSFLSGADQ
jgi:hypothetical protein